MSELSACSICQESLSSDFYLTISCGHSFHAKCIVNWLRNPQSCASCPNCRHVEAVENNVAESEVGTSSETIDTIEENSRSYQPSEKAVLKMALHEAKLKRSSTGLKRRAKTLKKWEEELKSTEKQLSTHMKDYRICRNEVNRFKTIICKKAEMLIENMIYGKMKQSGLLDMRKRENIIKIDQRRKRRLYNNARRNLLQQWKKEFLGTNSS